MAVAALKTDLKEILPLRNFFLQENNFQIRYNAVHERNWSDSYLLKWDDITIGYGSVHGLEKLTDRDAIFEYFILPPFRKMARVGFTALIEASRAKYIECQSNDLPLTHLLYEFSRNIYTDVILFRDHIVTEYNMPDLIFRCRKPDDQVTGIKTEDLGAYIIEMNGEQIASGGFLLHYNFPFADLYMEVTEAHRRKGIGAFLIQELKKECYLSGRIPAARCNLQNAASRATMLKAGMEICGYMLTGNVILTLI
jgi:GNAT superfamily N-acetyltransferase